MWSLHQQQPDSSTPFGSAHLRAGPTVGVAEVRVEETSLAGQAGRTAR